jgi:NTP pyrophosphatase (non-canonical NTP hydrolase)
MTGNEYQRAAMRTKGLYDSFEDQITCATIGINGESGEVAEIIKKAMWHDCELDEEKLLDELGDVLWYIAFAADVMGETLEEVLERNTDKLRKRYPDGFDPERSQNRD